MCLCVRASESARVSEHVCCMCASLLPFSAFLKRSANALRACVHVCVSGIFFSGMRLKFLFFREVERFCFEDAYECVRVCVHAICVCACLCVRE